MPPAAERQPKISSQSATATRLRVARRVAHELAQDLDVVAVVAMGSLARGRCSHDSDVDLAVIHDNPALEPHFESRTIAGIVVDCEHMSRVQALQTVRPRRRDLKSLRDAARLGQGRAVLDRSAVVRSLRRAAAAVRPAEAAIRRHVEGSYRTLIAAAAHYGGQPEWQWDALRSAYDSASFVQLHLRPVRYQKPKWVVHDLMRSRETELAQGMLEAYFAQENSAAQAASTIEGTRALIEKVAATFELPGYAKTLALGYTEDHAALSYICRSLADAESLAADGEAHIACYVARFAARMAVSEAAALAGKAVPNRGGLFPILQDLGSAGLLGAYRAVFDAGAPADGPGRSTFERCLVAIQSAAQRYQRVYGAAQDTQPEGVA